MAHKERSADSPDDEEDAGLDLIASFLERHEKQISQAIEAWIRNFEKASTRRLWVISGIFFLAAIIVALTGYLTAIGKLSSDAFAFLMGSIIGYLFSYLKSIHTVSV